MADQLYIGFVGMAAVQKQVSDFVDRFGKQFGFTCVDVMKQVMRMWVNDMLKMSAPYSTSDLVKMGVPSASAQDYEGNSMTARMIGKRAVERDLRKIFMPVDDEANDAKRWWTDNSGQLWFKKIDGTVMKVAPETLQFLKGGAAQSAMASHHREYRGADGRVKRRTKLVYVRANQFQKYLKAEQAAVGRLKAGWVVAIRALGGKTPPSWISANPRGTAGSASVATMNEQGTGYLSATNSVPYVLRKLLGIANASAVTRQKHLERTMTTKAGVQLIELINKAKTVEQANSMMGGGKLVSA